MRRDKMKKSIESLLQLWLEASNKFDTKAYLKFYDKGAVLEDSSVGEVYNGHSGIQEYFNDYFIGYNTQTRIIQLSIAGQKAHIDAEFTGNTFKNIKGVFDITFAGDKIKFVKAYLV